MSRKRAGTRPVRAVPSALDRGTPGRDVPYPALLRPSAKPFRRLTRDVDGFAPLSNSDANPHEPPEDPEVLTRREVRRTGPSARGVRMREAGGRPAHDNAVRGSFGMSRAGDARPSAQSPWPPLCDRADRESDDFEGSTAALASEPGTKLREEVTYDRLDEVRSVPWGEAVRRFRAWYDETRETRIVTENDLGERTSFRAPNRFTPEYREMLYAKAQALERGLREKWGKMLHTAMLTFTCSTTDDAGNPRPPVEHLEELLGSWEANRRALARVLDGRDWEYLAILEPHESGYTHVHVGVFVKGPIVEEQFRPVLDAHLRNCEGASREAHQVFDENGEPDSVRVRRASHPSRNDGVENLGAYLAAYMAGEYAAEPAEMPENVQAFYATMWATGRQWFRPSNGAQEHMKPDDGDGEDEEESALTESWEFVGIAPEGPTDDLHGDDVIELDPAAAGAGSVYRRLRGPDPPPGGRSD